MKTMKPKELMLMMTLPEGVCDLLTKMMIGYSLHMPMNEPMYYEKLKATVEFMEQCLPEHPGAFAAYFRILDKFPATQVRHIPEMMMNFIEANQTEIEKYYEGKLPEKYLPKKIITQDKTLVDAQGTPLNSAEPKKLILV